MRKYQATIAMMQIMISKLQLTLVGFPPYEVTISTLGSKKIEIIKKIPLSGTSSFSFPLAFTQAPSQQKINKNVLSYLPTSVRTDTFTQI